MDRCVSVTASQMGQLCDLVWTKHLHPIWLKTVWTLGTKNLIWEGIQFESDSPQSKRSLETQPRNPSDFSCIWFSYCCYSVFFVFSPSVKCFVAFQSRLVLLATCVLLITRLQGQLTEGLDVVDYLMEQPNVVPRMNPLILSTERQYLDFTANPGDRCVALCIFSFILIFDVIWVYENT